MISNQTTLHRVVAAVLVVASGIALMVAVRSAQAAPQTPLSVFIKAEHLDGTRPDGGPVGIRLNLDAHGNDASALAATGTAFSTTGAHVEWSMTGSMTGDVLTLTGVVTDANNPALIGMLGWLEANAATGTATISWWLTSGPFANQPGIASGGAKVDIRAS
jgi:hypothetical protein